MNFAKMTSLILVLLMFGQFCLTETHPKDVDALVTLFMATAFEVPWDVTGDPCSDNWKGVKCNTMKPQRITELNLSNMYLEGNLPPIITEELEHLRTLDLSFNLINGSVPEIRLPNINNLNLRGNFLTAPLNSHLFNSVTQLTKIDVSFNQIEGPLPEVTLPHLRILHLGHNQLTGTIPSSLARLPLLNSLTIDNNQFSGELVSQFVSANITTLYANSNFFQGTIPESYSSLSRLEELQLDNNFLAGSIPAGIASLPLLSRLHLHKNMLSGTLPKLFATSKALVDVNVGSNELEGALPKMMFQNIPQTKRLSLDISYNNFQGEIPANLKSKSFDSIYLSNNHLSGKIPKEFCDNPQCVASSNMFRCPVDYPLDDPVWSCCFITSCKTE